MHTNNHRLRHVSSSNSLNLYKSSPGVQGRVGKARAKVSYSAADRKGRAVGEIEMWSQGYIRRWLLSGKGAKTQKLVILQSGPLLESIGRHFLNSLPLLVSLPERWPSKPSLHCSNERSRSEEEDPKGTRCKCHKELSSHFSTLDQPILTAIGADYVCRQGKIRDRAVARCAGKIEQSIRPLDCIRRVSYLIKHTCMPDDLQAYYQGIAPL